MIVSWIFRLYCHKQELCHNQLLNVACKGRFHRRHLRSKHVGSLLFQGKKERWKVVEMVASQSLPLAGQEIHILDKNG